MSLTEYDRLHIPAIIKQPGSYDWFSAQLIRLIAKADAANRATLRIVYPEHVRAYEDWYYGLGVWKRKEEARP